MNESFFKEKSMRILTALTIFMALIALASYATLNFEKVDFLNPAPATISVSGEGEVFAVPDVGRFSFSVTAEAGNASEAQELSGTKINDIIDYLKGQGIEEKDIKTQNYNLNPKWKWEDKICPFGTNCQRERVQDGFTVSQSISVKVRDTDKAGEIISGVGDKGATNISGLDFTIDDTDKLQAEARAEAIADAQEKAAVLANQLGVKIVRLASYYEDGGNYYQPVYESKAMSMDMAEEGFGGAAMPMGEESTSARVNIVYEVR